MVSQRTKHIDVHYHLICDYVVVFSWPLLHEFYLNYEVVMFQPWIGTSPDLGPITNCYIAILLIHNPQFLPSNWCSHRGGYALVSLLSIPFWMPCLHTGSLLHKLKMISVEIVPTATTFKDIMLHYARGANNKIMSYNSPGVEIKPLTTRSWLRWWWNS